MRKYDSSKTRVEPLFDYLDDDVSKFNLLLKLINNVIDPISDISNLCYGKEEISIPPSIKLLEWCLNNKEKLNQPENYGVKKSSPTYREREALFQNEDDIIIQALNELKSNKSHDRKWYSFEGPTHPDIFFETTDSVFIGEAKRTEQHLTTETIWLKERDQLIRHVDALLETTDKKIYSFYIISKSMESKYYMDRYKDKIYFMKSLPHRADDEIKRVMNSYIGFTTWEIIEEEFSIIFPETVFNIEKTLSCS